MNRKIQIISILVLVIGLVAGIILMKNPQIFKSKASNGVEIISREEGKTIECNGTTECHTQTQHIRIDFTNLINNPSQ